MVRRREAPSRTMRPGMMKFERGASSFETLAPQDEEES